MDIALKKKNVYNPVEVMNMSKEVKTNAMRMLDKHHIRYDMIQYECDEFIDGLHTAEKTGAPVEQSFKTLERANNIMFLWFPSLRKYS